MLAGGAEEAMFTGSDVSVTCTAESETHKKIMFHTD